MEPRPYLLLDVDGPLNPYRAKTPPPGYRRRELREGGKTWSLLLNPEHAVELNALAEVFEPAWASSWEHGANRLIAPALGLSGDWPVISWPPGARQPAPLPDPPGAAPPRRAGDGVSWKTRHVADWVGERPFVWVDDEVGEPDQTYLAGRADRDPGLGLGSTPGLGVFYLHRVEADRGLVPADFAAIRAWADVNC